MHLIIMTSKYIKQKLTKLRGQIDKSISIMGDFNTIFSVTYGTN